MQKLMRVAEELRQLSFVKPVELLVEDHVAMRDYVDRAIDREQLERARRRYVALGVLAPGLDVRATLLAVMEEELIGYYDPERKLLAVRSDMVRDLDGPSSGVGLASRATLVHELVHALQDQHFDLGRRIHEQRTTDEENAFGALVEGDATLVTLAFAAREQGQTLDRLVGSPEQVGALMQRTDDQLSPVLRDAPALLREPLLFRYREGARYCAGHYHRAGWTAIDALHRAPPVTTLAVQGATAAATPLHPPLDLAALAKLGFTTVDADVLGSLELGIVLSAGDPENGPRLGRAWRGDRYWVLERAGQLASMWVIQMVDAPAARRAELAFSRLRDPRRHVTRQQERLLITWQLSAEALELVPTLSPSTRDLAPSTTPSIARALGGDRLASAAREH